MSYMHIKNLYKDPTVLMFRRLFALEKINGTSAHVTWKQATGKVHLFPGGGSAVTFEAMFDVPALEAIFRELVGVDCTVYGEHYGGGGAAGMKMSATYGKVAKFVVFDVVMHGADRNCWLSVPQADAFAGKLGLEFVSWIEIDAAMEAIDAARDADSVQAVRNGCGTGHVREGVVLRPLVEMVDGHGERVMCKHRREEFVERRSGEPKPGVDPGRLEVLRDAQSIADEWVVPTRLLHVLMKLSQPLTIRDTGTVVRAMVEDVTREAAGEIVVGKEAVTAIGRKAAELFHAHLRGGS